MKLKKKLALVMATAATITSLGGITAFANNSGDTPWDLAHWSNAISECNYNTPARPKTDDSSAYGRVLKGNEAGESLVYMQLKDDKGNNLVGGYKGGAIAPATPFNGNEAKYVINYAYENGYKNVRMGILQKALKTGAAGCNGLWSPDSY